MPLGGAGLAALAGALIAAGVDWRTVLASFGIVAFVLLAVPMPLIMRRQPEDLGLLPDGDTEPTSEEDASVQQRHRGTEASWTLRESLRTRAMWLVCVGSLIQTAASGGIAFLMPTYFVRRLRWHPPILLGSLIAFVGPAIGLPVISSMLVGIIVASFGLSFGNVYMEWVRANLDY